MSPFLFHVTHEWFLSFLITYEWATPNVLTVFARKIHPLLCFSTFEGATHHRHQWSDKDVHDFYFVFFLSETWRRAKRPATRVRVKQPCTSGKEPCLFATKILHFYRIGLLDLQQACTRVRESHVTHFKKSCHTRRRVMPHTWRCERVTSQTYKSHAAHIKNEKESCHRHMRVMPHT